MSSPSPDVRDEFLWMMPLGLPMTGWASLFPGIVPAQRSTIRIRSMRSVRGAPLSSGLTLFANHLTWRGATLA